jgi:hypothetical protein
MSLTIKLPPSPSRLKTQSAGETAFSRPWVSLSAFRLTHAAIEEADE